MRNQHQLDDMTGVAGLGFLQPAELVGAIVQNEVFVLPMDWDNGQALVGSCPAGLPAICSSTCGASLSACTILTTAEWFHRVIRTG